MNHFHYKYLRGHSRTDCPQKCCKQERVWQQSEQWAEAGGVARRLFADSCPAVWKHAHLFRLIRPPHFPPVGYLGSSRRLLVFPAPPLPGPAALRASSSLSLLLDSVMLTCCDMLHWNYFMKSILHSQSVTPTSKHTASLHVCVCVCAHVCVFQTYEPQIKAKHKGGLHDRLLLFFPVTTFVPALTTTSNMIRQFSFSFSAAFSAEMHEQSSPWLPADHPNPPSNSLWMCVDAEPFGCL